MFEQTAYPKAPAKAGKKCGKKKCGGGCGCEQQALVLIEKLECPTPEIPWLWLGLGAVALILITGGKKGR
jgi:hypothetical protein